MAERDDFDAWCQQSITDVLATLIKHHGRDRVLTVLGGRLMLNNDHEIEPCPCHRYWRFAVKEL